MNTRASPTNSAPSRKKKDASPSNASTKQSAACIRFGNVAAASAPASVKIAMMTNATLFIRSKIFGGQIVGQAHRLPPATIWQAARLPYNRRRNPCFCSFSETINTRREFPSRIQQDRHRAVNNHDHEERPQPSTQSAPRIMPNRSGDDARERHRQHEFPGDIHHLIHAHARKRAAKPDVNEKQRAQL